LTERAAEGIAIASLDGDCTVIWHVHRMHGVPDPVSSETVRQVRLGLRRTYGTAPRRLARPLSTADIRQILGAIDRTSPVGIRDAAIILLGYASAMRRSELVALTLVDLEEKPAGLLISIRRSKTDQEGHGQTIAVARGHRPDTDPVAALAAWRRLRGHTPGPQFTRCWKSRIGLEPLSGDALARMLRARAADAGLDATRITAHSLRAGHATTAALSRVPLARIAAQTDARTSPSWSTATSGPSKPWPPPPVATSACEPAAREQAASEQSVRAGNSWCRGARRAARACLRRPGAGATAPPGSGQETSDPERSYW
jgi:integrase